MNLISNVWLKKLIILSDSSIFFLSSKCENFSSAWKITLRSNMDSCSYITTRIQNKLDWSIFNLSTHLVILCIEIRKQYSLHAYSLYIYIYIYIYTHTHIHECYETTLSIFKQIYETQTGSATPGQSRPGSNCNEGWLHIHKRSRTRFTVILWTPLWFVAWERGFFCWDPLQGEINNQPSMLYVATENRGCYKP